MTVPHYDLAHLACVAAQSSAIGYACGLLHAIFASRLRSRRAARREKGRVAP